MFKKLVVFFLAAMLTLTLVGCGEEPSVPSPSAAEITITGTVTDATMNVTTIKTTDGKELVFATTDAQKNMKDGLLLGDVVAITYTGDIKDGDASAATVLTMKDGADNSKNPLRLAASSAAKSEVASKPTETQQTVTGTVSAVGMSAITIKIEDGTELSFVMDGADNTLADGPQEGQKVTLVYTGDIVDSDASACALARIEPVAE